MDLKLKDKVVLIIAATGDSSTATAKAFANEGCTLAVTSTSQAKLDALIPQLKGAKAVKGYVCDITKEADVEAAVNAVVNDFGRIDVCLTCSGYEGIHQEIIDATYEESDINFQINFYGCLWVLKHVGRQMKVQNGGTIVVLASNGSYVCCGGIPAYGACKHAVAGLLKSAAKEFMAFGARVNYICPGGLDTKLMRKTVENFLPGKTYEEGCEIFSHAYLDNRLCTVEDVANAMLFLASDVSSHMIGDALCLDGGLAVDRK